MRRFILATLAATLAVTAIAPAIASADVPRYQSGTLTTTLTRQGYVHTYDLIVNPSDGTFTGTGTGAYSAGGATFSNESITGKIVGNKVVDFTATYQSPGIYPGYQWGVKLGDQANMWDSWGGQFPVTMTLDVSHYKNHGDFVSSQPDRDDAAHSLIGMPINSSN